MIQQTVNSFNSKPVEFVQLLEIYKKKDNFVNRVFVEGVLEFFTIKAKNS